MYFALEIDDFKLTTMCPHSIGYQEINYYITNKAWSLLIKLFFTTKTLYWTKSFHDFSFKWNPLFQKSSDWNKSLYNKETQIVYAEFSENCIHLLSKSASSLLKFFMK